MPRVCQSTSACAGLTLPAAVEAAAFHTVAEAVTNLVRHSDATKVDMTVVATADQLTVTIADNSGATTDWQPGVGLPSMRERADELGGTFS